MSKAACVDTDPWVWIQKNVPSANGRKAWLTLVAHYDSYGELNKRVQRATMELLLWFSNKLHCSLNNPHQIRSHGYSVCDDPWDPHWPLGIDLDGMFIPLLATGPNLFFESQVPTDWEMEALLIIEITAPVLNPADLHMSRPLSTLTSVVNCISTDSRDIWSDLATHLFATSYPLPAVMSLHTMFNRLLYTMHLRKQTEQEE